MQIEGVLQQTGGISPAGVQAKSPKPGAVSGQFKAILQEKRQAAQTLKFSAHATRRLQERGIKLSPERMERLEDAIDRASAKGVRESLILLDDLVLIVSIKNRVVVTALDKESVKQNVFTNIDGVAVI